MGVASKVVCRMEYSLVLCLCLLGTLFLCACSSSIRYTSKSPYTDGPKTGLTTRDVTIGSEPSLLLDPQLSADRRKIVQIAQEYLGKKYCYGGNGPSCFDCSGFVLEVLQRCGYTNLPRTAAELSATLPTKHNDWEHAQPGDLIFFDFERRERVGHVGIVMNDGLMIHASTQRGIVIEDFQRGVYGNCKLWYGFLLR